MEHNPADTMAEASGANPSPSKAEVRDDQTKDLNVKTENMMIVQYFKTTS